ncbi:amidase [Pseudomonas marincola]|uniref:amidase n=1 Tax=Pseudomonas marincola TaxID=437900 RepID=UPI0008F130DC|nr:amidase family protein [Pseudomonas marincola]SFU14329.1 amidase/6-aminohexanoate-cyclic-dimer hydrolase [Pseudomonas marincola]
MKSISRRSFLATSGALAGGFALQLPFSAASAASSSMRFDEYRQHDAIALADLLRRGEVCAAELLEIAISRTEEINPSVNAVVLKHYDAARELVKNSKPNGPFGGVPFLLKDLGVSMKGTVTTNGSRFFKDAVASHDDPYVLRARQAGLVIFGKTHSPEFGNNPSAESTLFGDTHNPWNLAYSAGGSSGGSAAAVAAGIVPVAHASDGGGSIRIPASACGLFGLKPSRGLVPIGSGRGEVRGGLAAQHVISRSVRDTAGLLDALAWTDLGAEFAAQAEEGSYLAQMQREPGKLRIAVMFDPLMGGVLDPQCRLAVSQAAELCSGLGHSVEEVRPSINLSAAAKAAGVMSMFSLAQTVNKREQQLGRKVTEADLEPADWQMLVWGRQLKQADYDSAHNALRRAGSDMAVFMQKYDLILSSTLPDLPPKLGAVNMSLPLEQYGAAASRMSSLTTVFNITGQPAMSVPLHWSESGLPIGIMFAGRFGEERTLLRIAAQLEQAHPWFKNVANL